MSSIKLTIYETTDYDHFKQIAANREVNMKHVRELAADIQIINLLDVSPIICNERLEIIDGQHRLAAAKLLKLPIYYLIKKDLQDDHIGHLNRNQKNWAAMDYITFYTLKKRPGFDVLSKFMRKYNLNWSVACMLLGGTYRAGRKQICNGVVSVKNLKEAEQIMGYVNDLQVYGTFVRESKFINALTKMVADDDYEHDLLLKALKRDSKFWNQQVKKKDYITMIDWHING